MSLLAAVVLMAAQAAPALSSATSSPAEPSAEELEIGRVIALESPSVHETTIKAMLELGRIIDDNPDLSFEEKMRLRQIGISELKVLHLQTIESEARAYADRLSLDELRALAADRKSTVATGKSSPLPTAEQFAGMVVRDTPFGASIRTAFCAETGKLCP